MLITTGLALGVPARIIVSIHLAGNEDVEWIQLTLVNTVTSLHVTHKARNF
jgi:hypothetical protein